MDTSLVLGQDVFGQSVRRVDGRLSKISQAFDFLRHLTPINAPQAWSQFRRNRYSRTPRFRYHTLPFSPDHLKRQLFNVPLEWVEHPLLHQIFSERRLEMERQLTMLACRGSGTVLCDSLALYGTLPVWLSEAAREILDTLSPHNTRGNVTADRLVQLAEKEILYYRHLEPSFSARVVSDPDLDAGIMVERDMLRIGGAARIAASRVNALMYHEVGTHLLTYYNGQRQPLRILADGLAGYDELQEGLAVLAEWASGHLTPRRLRQLAARVVAVESLIQGASFADCFDRLVQFGVPRPRAFRVAMRVYRGGGLTKDAVYLRGLYGVLAHLKEEATLAPLYAGKVAIRHIPLLIQLLREGILRPPALLPRFFHDARVHDRLQALMGASVTPLALLQI